MRLLHLVNIRKKIKQKSQPQKILLSVFFIMIIFINFLYFNDNFNLTNSFEDNLANKNENIVEDDISIPNTAADVSILQDPFTKNFSLMRDFFDTNYNSSLDYNVSTYFRLGSGNGTITDDTIYSEDNLLLYKTLKQSEINQTETFDTYLKLQETNLWYNGSNDYDYGFVKSINGTNSSIIIDDNRYLIDNLLPIFLLIENIGENIDDIDINGTTPKDSIDEMFDLINSSLFWDKTSIGFSTYNRTVDNDKDKDTESNFYAILANLLIHRTYKKFNLSSTIADRAYDLANQTMIALNKSAAMWNPTKKAFISSGDNDWVPQVTKDKTFRLDVNALGIITILEYWIETGKNNISILQQAIDLYDSLNNNLWNSTYNFYSNNTESDNSWNPSGDIDLKANAMMMSACLKLFEVTGNITYHDRAMEIFNSTEYRLLNWTSNAYNSSLIDNSKNFNYNLHLIEAYLNAYDIYTNTVLSAEYSVSEEIPEFIFNQDNMIITSTYSFNKIQQYYNPEKKTYIDFTINSVITDASINYLLKYPNGSYLYQRTSEILRGETSHTLSYKIPETLPIDQGYYVYIWADSEYFKMYQTSKRFNVSSGLVNKTIEGIDDILYQGPTLKVSLLFNNTRSDNITLNASLEGEDIINFPAQEFNATTFKETLISFNLMAKLGVIPGSSEIFFKIKSGNIIYLEIKKVIEIGYSFDYSNLLYQYKVVSGDSIYVSMNLINFLPNDPQSLNVSFLGITEDTIENFTKEEVLIENEIKTVSYNLNTKESIKNNTIQIKMSITINTTEYYTELLTVEMVSKYEIMSVSFPEKIPQGTRGYLIIVIQNNQKNSEEFSLFINGKSVGANINELVSGENKIIKKITPTINPYEVGKKTYIIVIKDNLGEEIARFYFEIELEISTVNLVLFFIMPIVIPIGIVLYFLNKDIKHKKLRR